MSRVHSFAVSGLLPAGLALALLLAFSAASQQKPAPLPAQLENRLYRRRQPTAGRTFTPPTGTSIISATTPAPDSMFRNQGGARLSPRLRRQWGARLCGGASTVVRRSGELNNDGSVDTVATGLNERPRILSRAGVLSGQASKSPPLPGGPCSITYRYVWGSYRCRKTCALRAWRRA